MPVVLRVKGYKFWFYEADLSEPPHVHVGKDGKHAKYWFDPVTVAHAGGFKLFELSEIERIIQAHRDFLMATWEKEQGKRGNR